ncbi:hypothetical protein [Maricaulis sp.]|uniref:hypothetical protein n=1 Tax=Maricaulis sp. TaxID=1486257 RepID=UPI003A923CA3
MNDLTLFLQHVIQSESLTQATNTPVPDTTLTIYVLGLLIFSAFAGCALGRLSTYGVPGLDLLGRLYYGGLYGVYRGWESQKVFVSIVSKHNIDNKTTVYHGLLEEIRVNHSGRIEYVSISDPMKSIAFFHEGSNNIRSSSTVEIGKYSFSDANAERRMLIEGDNVTNIFFKKQDFKSTLENQISFYYRSISDSFNENRHEFIIAFLFITCCIILIAVVLANNLT